MMDASNARRHDNQPNDIPYSDPGETFKTDY
jgi:hypothetical protein